MSGRIETVELGRVAVLHALRLMFGPTGPSTPALAAMARLVTPVRIAKGTVIGREGSPFGSVYLVLEGSLQATRNGQLYGVFEGRTSVGLLSALARDDAGTSCEALVDTTALVLRAEDMFDVLEDQIELMEGAMRGLSGSAIELRKRLPDAGFAPSDRTGIVPTDEPLDLTERILLLRETFGLQRSYIDELAQLARASEQVRYRPGTRLWSVGEPATHYAIPLSGRIAGSTPQGAVFSFGPGDIVGSLDIFAQQPRWFDAVATEDTVALSMTMESMLDVWEDQPGLGLDNLRMLAATLLKLRERAARVAEPQTQAQTVADAQPRP